MFRPRILDLFAVVGLLVLLAATPVYVAQGETEDDLSDGTRFTMGAVRLGTTIENEVVFRTPEGEVKSIGPVETKRFRAAGPGEVPVVASYVYEEWVHPVDARFPWGTYRSEEEHRQVWFDDEGRPVWIHEVEWVMRGETLHRQESSRRWWVPDHWVPNLAAGTTIDYHPLAAKRMVGELIDMGTDRFTRYEPAAGDLTTSDAVYEHRGEVLFRIGGRALGDLWWREPYTDTCTDCDPAFEPGGPGLPAEVGGIRKGGWVAPDWPMYLGKEIHYTDERSGETFLVQQDLPMDIQVGDGPLVRLRPYFALDEKAVSARPALLERTLQGILDDERPIYRGVGPKDLHEILRSDAAPVPIRSFAEDSLLVDFYWLRGDAFVPGLTQRQGDLRGLLPSGSGEEGPEVVPVRWFVTLASADGRIQVVELRLLHSAAGAQVEAVTDACDLDPDRRKWDERLLPDTSCDPVAPWLASPDRLVSDPWHLYARARDEHKEFALGDARSLEIDRFGFLPLARAEVRPTEDGHPRGTTLAAVRPPDLPSWNWGRIDSFPPFAGRAVAGGSASTAYAATYGLDDGGLLSVETRSGDAQAPASSPRSITPGRTSEIDVVPAAAITGGVLLVLVSALSRLGIWLKTGGAPFIFTHLYAKIAKADVLLNARREDLVDLVRAEPGIHTSEVARCLGFGWGATVHHLETLVRNGVLVSTTVGNRRQYFVPDAGDRASRREMAARRDADAAAFLDLVTARPGISVSEIAQASGQGLSRASRLGKRLARDGLVVKHRQGKSVGVWPAGAAPSAHASSSSVATTT